MKSPPTTTNFKRFKDPTELLKRALAERCARNPQYSVRAFARSSGISHTVLSLVLSGKRRLSKKATLKLADYLELDPRHRNELLKAHKGTNSGDDYQSLPLDTFEVISDWYHYGILSLMELPGALFEARWIAKRLGIKILSAKLAMERLVRLGLIAQLQDGQWRQTGKSLKVDNSISTAATRKFHRQLLERACESMESDPISVRDFSAITFTLDHVQVEYARKRLREFRRHLVAELETKGQPTSVYELTMQLFPLTPTTFSKVKGN